MLRVFVAWGGLGTVAAGGMALAEPAAEIRPAATSVAVATPGTSGSPGTPAETLASKSSGSKPAPQSQAAAPAAPDASIAFASPADGAVVWGEIGLSVERVFDPRDPQAGKPDAQVPPVRLRLPDGSLLEPLSAEKPREGLRRRYGFLLDTAALPDGEVTLVAECLDARGEVRATASLVMFARQPAEGDLIRGEAESLKDAPRSPRHASDEPLNTAESPEASGGAYVVNNGARPPMTYTLTIEEAGWYQALVTAGGTPTADILPTIGVRLGDANRPATASLIALESWHRTPVGRPLWYKPGEHHVAFYYENDQNFGRGHDRNLRLDTYELCRLPDEIGERAAERGWLGVALTSDLHGRAVSGRFVVEGYADLDDRSLERPRVTLLVNGQPIASQFTSRPSFVVPRDRLQAGSNTLQLAAEDRLGQRGVSAIHTVTLAEADEAPPAEAAGADPSPTRARLFAADPGWVMDKPRRLMDGRRSPDPVVAFHSNGKATLPLDPQWAGRYEVVLRGRGDSFEGHPLAAVTLVRGEERQAVGEVEFNGGYRNFAVGGLDLPAGAKSLEIAFTNDRYDAAEEKDRNLFLHYVELRRVPGPDKTPPAGVVRYPAAGQVLRAVDAVVVDVADNQGMAWAQVLVDGRPIGGRVGLRDGRGRVLLPLVLREVEPGERRLAVRLSDAADNRVDLEALTVEVESMSASGSTQESAEMMSRPFESAVRLLDRFAYGPEPAALAEVLVKGESAYLAQALAMPTDAPGWRDAWHAAELTRRPAYNGGPIPQRAAHFLLNTPNPVQARLVMFIDNHFNTWMRKIRPYRKGAEFARWVELGVAPFGELLHASATSPAMLHYLDQTGSFARRINENYAREIMELHTLGVHGGYTQRDVTELAGLLTGWSSTAAARPHGGGHHPLDHWVFVAHRHDMAPRTVLGHTFDKPESRTTAYARVLAALDLLAHHPSTAAFISRKLADHYLTLSPEAGEALTAELADIFLDSRGDLRRVVRAIAASPAYREAPLEPRLTHPLNFTLRLQRLTGDTNDGRTFAFTRSAGSGLFDRETPDGFPEEDEAYADSNAILQRWKLAQTLDYHFPSMLPYNLRRPVRDADEAQMAAWRQRSVDELAVRLTGRLLSERSNEAVMSVLARSSANPDQTLRLAGSLIAQMPEMSLR